MLHHALFDLTLGIKKMKFQNMNIYIEITLDWYKYVSHYIYIRMKGNVNLYVSLINVNTAIKMHCKMFNRSG